MNLFDRPLPSAPAVEPSDWDKDRNRVMGAREPPGSYGLCWKDLPGDFKCELAIGHSDGCGLEPTPLRPLSVGSLGTAPEPPPRVASLGTAPEPPPPVVSLALQPAPATASPSKATVGIRRISHSELVSFLTCNRLHYFSYRLRREPRTTAEPLLVGRRVENIIKQIWLGETPDLSNLPPEERAICKAYPIWWRHHTLHVKRVDIPFQVEISGVQYIGEFDGDGEDKGEDIIVELKTTSEDIGIGAPYWRRVAQTDPQVTTYLMAARAQGRKLRRVVYDVIRKATLEQAKATPLEKRKYTKVTKASPVSRLHANMREFDETDDEFELRILEDIAEKPERYFQRHDIVRYEDEHQAHMRDVAGNVRLMQLVETMPEAPRNVNSCFKWGRVCPFLPVCLGEDRIDNEFLYQDRVRRKKNEITDHKTNNKASQEGIVQQKR